MNKLLSFVLLILPLGLSAQTYLLSGGTNNVAGPATNTYATMISMEKAESIAIGIQFSSLGTNDSAIKFKLFPSVDGTIIGNYTSNLNFTVPANGTNVVSYVTNIVLSGTRYLHLDSVINPNGSKALTNVYFFYNLK